MQKLYLKQNVLVEPLVNQWYMWSHLIAPQTAAMHIANSHLKMMQSFVAAPHVHAAALKDPAMLGGPFINYDATRVSEIEELMRRTAKEQARLLEFAAAVSALDAMLSADATGNSLEPLYQKVPEILKGYVELVYDLNNHPSIRFIEGMLYKSPLYSEATQSVALSLIEREDRPFAFSTPWLPKPGCLPVTFPFKFAGYDEMFRMKSEPQPNGHLHEMFLIEHGAHDLFSSFFTTAPPPPPQTYTGDGVRIRYLGHACLLIEAGGLSLLCDPLVSYQYPGGIPRYTFADLPEQLDFVLITHNHQDHCMFETLLQLRYRIKNVVVPKCNGGALADPSLKHALQNVGFKNVIEIDEGETLAVEGGGITGLPFLGEHADLNVRTKIAYLISLKGRSIICAADSNNIEPQLYEHINCFAAEIDVLFVGMECDGAPLSWLYGPLMTKPFSRKMDQSRRLDGSTFEKARKIIDSLRPKQVYVYAMGQEPWLTFLTSIKYTAQSRPIVESNKLVEECRKRGILSERLFGQKQIHLQAQ